MIAAATAPIVVIGGGGHARVVIDALQCMGRTIAGVLDRDPQTATRLPPGIPYLGDDDALDTFQPDAVLLANGLGSVGKIGVRRLKFEQTAARGFRYVTVRHPSAVIAADVSLGEGAQIMAGSVIQAGARIGHNVLVNTSASIDHDCEIGPHCHIAPGVVLSGGVRVGEACHIGTGAVIVQGAVIGAEAVIGAGVVVLENIAPGSLFVGKR